MGDVVVTYLGGTRDSFTPSVFDYMQWPICLPKNLWLSLLVSMILINTSVQRHAIFYILCEVYQPMTRKSTFLFAKTLLSVSCPISDGYFPSCLRNRMLHPPIMPSGYKITFTHSSQMKNTIKPCSLYHLLFRGQLRLNEIISIYKVR